jgi:uncharacterized protein (DUF1800 family)
MTQAATSPSSRELPAYNPASDGGWSAESARHLLWRSGFGATPDAVQQAVEQGLAATVERLVNPQPESTEFEEVSPLLRQIAEDTSSIGNLKAWWLHRMAFSANPLLEKMSLFWHNHFATSYTKVLSVGHMADQNDLIRQYALGDFRKLLHGMTADVAMLIWLDGNANRKRHPNENFAREVMELFSLGVGNYTEHDIVEAARAFTGWHVRDDQFWFNKSQHDTGTKTVFGHSGKFNGKDVIELCLAHEACPRFLATKLLRQFVTPQPRPEHVTALAGTIRRHEFQMATVLAELFTSQLFFAPENRRAIIKSPIELVIGSFRTLSVRPNFENTAKLLAELGQDVFQPPTVKGWDGVRLWISSASLLQRNRFVTELLYGNRLGTLSDATLDATFAAGSGVEPVRFWGTLLLSLPADSDVWNQLAEYRERADTREHRADRRLIHLLMSLPEFQLC